MYGLHVEGLVAAGAEHGGEMLGLDAAEHDIGVGDGQRAAAPVAGGPGDGAGGVGADAVALAVEVEDGAAAGGDGVDVHRGARMRTPATWVP